jgi:hypothetical protein
LDLAYLGRSLNKRTHEAGEAYGIAQARIMADAAAKGALGSGRLLLQFEQEALAIFIEKANEAAQFTFNLSEANDGEVARQLDYCVGRMVELIINHVVDGGSRSGIHSNTAGPQVNKTRVALNEKKQQLMDDFTHGMMGSQRLKKDSVINIINNQTNSPGAIQQAGVGQFSQSAFVQNHQPLIDAVGKALASPEFDKLLPEQKTAFKDVADALLDEAKKDNPDPGKLKRWGSRLGEFAMQVGLNVASSEIIHVLGKIFP